MNVRIRAEAGQNPSAMYLLNEALVGADTPQPVELTVGVAVYPKGVRDGLLHVPMCSAIVRPYEGWDYPPHRRFNDGGTLRFYQGNLPLHPADRHVGANGIYRAIGTVLCAPGRAVFKPIAAVFLPTDGLDFCSSQYEYGAGCYEAAKAYCAEHGERLFGKRGSCQFLDDECGFNDDLDALLYWRSHVVLRPRDWKATVWGQRFDLRDLGVQYWLNQATAG